MGSGGSSSSNSGEQSIGQMGGPMGGWALCEAKQVDGRPNGQMGIIGAKRVDGPNGWMGSQTGGWAL